MIDLSIVAEIPVLTPDEYGRGIEWYAYCHMGEKPPTDQRPSRAQFTAIKAMIHWGLSYVDLGLLGPNDLRTARANRWASTIAVNGTPTWKEIRGPSDPDAYTACWNILQTGWTMANAILPRV